MTIDDPTLTIARLCRVLECNASADLTLPQYRVLGLLAGGDERASLLASRVSVAKPTLTSIVDSLFERGFVAREIPDEDRRSVSLSITTAGRTALANAAAEFREVLDEVLVECTDPERVLDALGALRDALDERWARRVSRESATVGDGDRR
ncbi:MAG: MarR family winged helix-turn-helix transcriptional regulator [Ilumatobacteraceae bacterium]